MPKVKIHDQNSLTFILFNAGMQILPGESTGKEVLFALLNVHTTASNTDSNFRTSHYIELIAPCESTAQ